MQSKYGSWPPISPTTDIRGAAPNSVLFHARARPAMSDRSGCCSAAATSTAGSSASSSTDSPTSRWTRFIREWTKQKGVRNGLSLQEAAMALEPGAHGWGTTKDEVDMVERALQSAGYSEEGLTAQTFAVVQDDMMATLQEGVRGQGLPHLVAVGDRIVPEVKSWAHFVRLLRVAAREESDHRASLQVLKQVLDWVLQEPAHRQPRAVPLGRRHDPATYAHQRGVVASRNVSIDSIVSCGRIMQ